MKEVRNWLMQFLVFIPGLVAYGIVLLSDEPIIYLPASFIVGLYVWAGAGKGLDWLTKR